MRKVTEKVDLVRDVVTGGGRLIVVQTNNATFGRSGRTLATTVGAAPEAALAVLGLVGLGLARRRSVA